jgi:uncharacterized protein YjbJ (UPF0337 family)
MNKDELAGTGKPTKGRVKHGVGGLTDDERLKHEGDVDETVERVRESAGSVRRKIGRLSEHDGNVIEKYRSVPDRARPAEPFEQGTAAGHFATVDAAGQSTRPKHCGS